MKNETTAGLWDACDGMELSAMKVIAEQLRPFAEPIRQCYEAGVLAPTLPARRHGEPDVTLAAPFLKRSLNDLRATWLLLLRGYTSSAAAVAASLFEHSLTVIAITAAAENVAALNGAPGGDVPWTPKELSQILAGRWRRKELAAGSAPPLDDYELAWRESYGAYRWLCKIKHPTLPSTLHDTRSTLREPGEYVVMASPDIRPGDLAVKKMILGTSINHTREAILAFAEALNCDETTEIYAGFGSLMSSVVSNILSHLKDSPPTALPFTLSSSKLARELRELSKQLDV